MSDTPDMILPMLREMRAENAALHQETRTLIGGLERRLSALEDNQRSYKQALTADTLLSRLLTGEFEQRIEALERQIADWGVRP